MGEQITKPKTSGKLWSSSMENNTVVDIFDVFIKKSYLMDGNLNTPMRSFSFSYEDCLEMMFTCKLVDAK